MKKFVLPYLEWEVLHKPITIPKVNDIKELPEGQKRIKIDRDERYKLRGILIFEGDYKLLLKELHRLNVAPAGSFVKTFEIQGSNQSGFKCYTLESCSISGGKISYKEDSQETSCEANLNLYGVKIKSKSRVEGTRLTQWCLNGPRDNIFYRVTDRKVLSSFFRERFASKEDKINSIKISREDALMVGADFLRIKACDFQFLVTKVPNGIGPSWSSNIGIEYRKAWGRIPDVREREKIEEICSFIFGRQLLPVGYTEYDKNGNMVEVYAHDPWWRDPRSLCSYHDRPPIKIKVHERGRVENVISQLLPKYYEKVEHFNFKDAFIFYWISRNMPEGTKLPILASAVETVINGWLESKDSKSHGRYMKEKEFHELMEPEIKTIKSKLERKLNKHHNSEKPSDEIIKKILNAHQFGTMEKFRHFFKEITLPVPDYEWKAIKKRHVFAHGGIEFDKVEWEEVIQLTQTYETLFHKIVLKLLGYSETYIDYSSVGWKDKQLG